MEGGVVQRKLIFHKKRGKTQKNMGLQHWIMPNNQFKKHLGKGSKIKLIFFAEYSAKWGGDPPSMKITKFVQPKKI